MRREKPSCVTSPISPIPSTWPCTTCPPRRSPARRGSSTLAFEPARRSPSVLRRSVSVMTSARKPAGSTAVAVRQTPSTATESPSRSSEASAVRTRRRTPSAVVSTASMRPRSCTSPVNIGSPFSQSGADEQVVSDPLAVERQCAHRLRDRLRALALERVAGGAPAHDDGPEEDPDLVDLPGVVAGAGEVGAALEQHARDPRGAERKQRRANPVGFVGAGGDDHVDAGHLQVGDGGAAGRTGDHDAERDLGRHLDEVGVEPPPPPPPP